MKKLCIIVAALALTLGLSQCKKAETPITDEGVRITLTAGYGGDRTAFTPSTGAFVWSSGTTEYIYVGGSAHSSCLGVLSGTGSGTGSMAFSGTLTTMPNDGRGQYWSSTTHPSVETAARDFVFDYLDFKVGASYRLVGESVRLVRPV